MKKLIIVALLIAVGLVAAKRLRRRPEPACATPSSGQAERRCERLKRPPQARGQRAIEPP